MDLISAPKVEKPSTSEKDTPIATTLLNYVFDVNEAGVTTSTFVLIRFLLVMAECTTAQIIHNLAVWNVHCPGGASARDTIV